MFRYYVFSVLLYDIEVRILADAAQIKLKSCDIYGVNRISSRKHLINKEVLRRMKKERNTVNLLNIFSTHHEEPTIPNITNLLCTTK